VQPRRWCAGRVAAPLRWFGRCSDEVYLSHTARGFSEPCKRWLRQA
jgi:hypothetical protein